MSNSSLKTAVENKEELYRFTFLRYLDAAEELLKLNQDFKDLEELIRAVDFHLVNGYGKKMRSPATDKAEEMLYRRYDLKNNESGLYRAEEQFYAELTVAQRNEQLLWADLVSIVKDCNMFWYHDNAEAHRQLLIGNEVCFKRIYFYRRFLQDFNSDSCCPEKMENIFILEHGHIADKPLL